jgi:UDP-GlcNAc:undecaprenyl-phosphate GlcNAc-1-phosphate transferase
VGTVLLFLLVPHLSRLSGKRHDARHAGKAHLPRFGGVALVFGFAVAVLFDPHLVLTREIVGTLVCSLLILLFGLWDDLREQDWHTQFFFQVSLCIIVFLFGVKILSITNPWGGAWSLEASALILPGFLILSAWILLVLNAVNWLDGLDGLLGGVTAIALLAIYLLSLEPVVNQPPIAILAAAGLGSVFGFLLFNFPPAKILAGTSGSSFLGFLIAILAVLSGTKIATALLVLALPITDSLFVIWKRLRARTSVFLPDTRHLHYRLRDLGWSERRIALFFTGATALIALVALNTALLGKLAAILIVLGSILLFLVYVEWRLGQESR